MKQDEIEPPAPTEIEIQALTDLGDLFIASILQGCPIAKIQSLIDEGAPLWYQTDDEGMSALHAAAYTQNEVLVELLLEKGAPWNSVDHLNNTAGDIALSMNNAKIYSKIRDAGLRSELLLTLLSTKGSVEPPSTLILRATDDTASGSTDTYLSSKLKYIKDEHGQDICLLSTEDGDVGVMMGWEKDIMQETVQKICHEHENLATGLKILNVGFGLGMIYSLFQGLPTGPSHHVIIEAHPDVLKHMREMGWYDKPNVHILEGKWQDVISSNEILGVGGFDVVYTDTFSEDYQALHEFFEHLPDLLAGPQSRFSFFNGLGATNALFYDVYTQLSELHLMDIGLQIDWSDVDVTADDESERWGRTRQYFSMPIFRLPVGKMAGI